jgi:hypothetical protein
VVVDRNDDDDDDDDDFQYYMESIAVIAEQVMFHRTAPLGYCSHHWGADAVQSLPGIDCQATVAVAIGTAAATAVDANSVVAVGTGVEIIIAFLEKVDNPLFFGG